MKAELTPLPDAPLTRLAAAESDAAASVVAGETLAYRCDECGRCDETVGQIWHAEDCPLAGEGGRQLYDDLERGHDRRTAELEPHHEILLVRAADSDPERDVYRGEPVAFACVECGNSDETLSEIVHDEACSLAGQHGRELLSQ